jgi:hypothetical protein
MRITTAIVLSLIAGPAVAADQGYFGCLDLKPSQLAWFKKEGIASCCDIADGMPTRYEVREDGVYVPPYSEAVVEARACRKKEAVASPGPDHNHWVRVPDKAIDVMRGKPNPIGVAIIWWSNASWNTPNVQHDVLCFIRDLEI